MQAAMERVNDSSDFYYDPTCVLYLPLHKMEFGLAADTKYYCMSHDHYGHLIQNKDTLWRPDGREFDGDDYILVPSTSTQLNFTSEDFSIIARGNLDSLTGQSTIFCRGLQSTDGYAFYVESTGRLSAATYQALALQASRSAPSQISISTWYTLGFSRAGASLIPYKNGVDISSTVGVHINPLTSARSAKIGTLDNSIDFPFVGKMKVLAIWNRGLSALEHMNIHQYLIRQVP